MVMAVVVRSHQLLHEAVVAEILVVILQTLAMDHLAVVQDLTAPLVVRDQEHLVKVMLVV